ncbi:transcriptional regulator [Clostridium sp. SY8519]|uniref:GntR family transcriptional regulator n=1 Tax=Clostridium sp. (strain SY8519) TaxID=1042156 RepID=UPI0002171DAB|nr:GntR family transcriptional regulator [Clostridium sp. SY8519]BAK48331.1 transcriptional regulator [Clostridium sp. SY8519]
MSSESNSLSSKVYHILEENILSGKYKPNEELKEKAIGDELCVSRTPVREALRQLELQGLVTITPNRGAQVVGISREDMYDILEIRSMLEGYCAQKAARHASDDQVAELEEIVYLTDFHVQRGNAEQVFEEDNRFHETLYRASGSKILEHVLSNFHHYLQRVRKVTLASGTRAAFSNDEHKAIVQAIRAHDGELAKKLANDHIMNTIKNIEEVGWDNVL